MDLGICPIGSAVEVRWMDLHDDERARLRELGIREGAILHVVNCGAFGARVVAIGSDRFAIDGRTCACIAVMPHLAGTAVVGSQELLGVSAPATTDSDAPELAAEPAAPTPAASSKWKNFRLHNRRPRPAKPSETTSEPEDIPARRLSLSKSKGEQAAPQLENITPEPEGALA